MHINGIVDFIFHGGNLGIFLVVAWYVIKRQNRDESLKKDYPPHRHINGSIVYPQEFTPNEVGHLKV